MTDPTGLGWGWLKAIGVVATAVTLAAIAVAVAPEVVVVAATYVGAGGLVTTEGVAAAASYVGLGAAGLGIGAGAWSAYQDCQAGNRSGCIGEAAQAGLDTAETIAAQVGGDSCAQTDFMYNEAELGNQLFGEEDK